MDPGQLFGAVIGGYLLVISSVAALSAVRSALAGEQERMGSRVFWAITLATIFIGVPTLIGMLSFLFSDARPGSSSGIMSSSAAYVVLFIGGMLGLTLVWAWSIAFGFIGTAIAKKLPPLTAGLVMFAVCAAAPLAMVTDLAVRRHAEDMRRQQMSSNPP